LNKGVSAFTWRQEVVVVVSCVLVVFSSREFEVEGNNKKFKVGNIL
jgi:hypothetical protein